MSKNIKEEDYCKWISLILSDNVKDVISEIKGCKLNATKGLFDCIVAIGKLTYEHVKNGKECNSNPEHVLQLTTWLCSIYCSEPSNSTTLRYLTSLYHILHWMLKKNHLDHVITLFEIIIKFKQTNLKSYEDDAKTLHSPFTYILREAVIKVVSKEVPVNRSFLPKLFSLLLEIEAGIKTLSSEKTLLECILQASMVVSKKDEKETVSVINVGLNLFYKSKNLKELGTALTLLFKIFTYLFFSQDKISGHHSALAVIKSHLETAKRRCAANVLQGECFLLASNSVMIFMGDCPENTISKKIKDNCDILKAFQNSQEEEIIHATCGFVIFMLLFACQIKRQNTPMIPESCLESFVSMMLNLCAVLERSPSHVSDILKVLTEICYLLVNNAYDKTVLKRSVNLVLKVEKCIEKNFNLQRTKSHSSIDKNTSVMLARLANLVRFYYIEKLHEEVITISKPICRYICTLPSDVFEDSKNVKSLDLSFTCLTSALGHQRLAEALECLVVWISKCPQSKSTAFKIWSDLKHNTVCGGSENDLEINVWTIVNERKSDFEREWHSLNLNIAEIGQLLVEELQSYYMNKTLRGKPVISAANALLSLNVDSLTQGKGLYIAMDIATSNIDFAELCTTYYNKSKLLINKLRKEKKNFEPVAFNCSMGDLLYAQLRYQIKNLRTKCECEMVKLSKPLSTPLIAELPESKPDPNDTCDIATRYQHLCLAQQRKLMDMMDSAIRHWSFACGMLKDTPEAKLDLNVTMSNLQGAGLLLKLYCDEIKEVKVWHLLYDLALVKKDVNMIVWAAGQLMTTNTNLAPEITSNIKTIMLNNSDLMDTTTLSYELNSALSALKNNKIPDGLTSLKIVEKADKKNGVQTSQYYSVIGQFQSLSDWTKYNHSFDSCPTVHFSLYLSFRRLLFQVKEKNWGSFGELCQQQNELMSVSYLLGHANWALEQPREARSYLKNALPIAQKLALPLRTVQLLLLLAWVDLNTGVVDDCAAKLEGLEDLLELCGTPVLYGSSVEPTYLSKAELHPPDYLSHPAACQCLPCSTVEYRRLVLETITLRATFCAFFGHRGHADQCFQVAKLVEKELSKSDRSEVCKSCATMWLRYADFKASLFEYHEATTANEKASKLLYSVQDPIILQQAFEQKISLQCSLRQLLFAPLRAKVVLEAKKTTPLKVMTPISLKSKPPENSPLATINDNLKVSPFTRPVRAFKLPSSGEENTPAPASKPKRKPRLPRKFVSETPENMFSFTKPSVKPFVIVNDDGKAVAISGAKTLPRARKKIPDPNSDSEQPKNSSKKKLFSSTTKTDSKVDLSIDSDEPVIIRMTTKSTLKTYGNSKGSSRKDTNQSTSSSKAIKQKKDHSKEELNGDVFSFDQLKDSITEIDNSICKPITEIKSDKSTSRIRLEKQSSKSIEVDSHKTKEASFTVGKISIDSNCDFIEGTPPQSDKKSVSLIPKRTTRSSKLRLASKSKLMS